MNTNREVLQKENMMLFEILSEDYQLEDISLEIYHDIDIISENKINIEREFTQEEATEFLIDRYRKKHKRLKSLNTDKNSVGIVLTKRKQLVGIILVNIETKYVTSLYVMPEYRRLGIGSYLLNLAEKKYGTMYLVVMDKNTEALEFYNTLGWVVFNYEKNFYHMCKKLALSEAKSNNVKKIMRKSMYIPDVYISSLSLLVEIKDGGSNPNTHPGFANNKMLEKLKENAVREQGGYNYIKIMNKNYKPFLEILEKLRNIDSQEDIKKNPIIITENQIDIITDQILTEMKNNKI